MMKNKIIISLLLLITLMPNRLQSNSNDALVENIQRHLNLIYQLNYKSKRLQSIHKSSFNISSAIDKKIEFNHELTCLCAKKIIKTNSINHVFETWQIYREFSVRNDQEFFKEFSIIILMIYKHYLVHILPQWVNNIPIEQMINLYNQSLDLPTLKVIESLNEFYIELKKILNELDINNNLGWNDWLKQYWYIPTSISVAILSVIFNNLKS